MSSYTIFNAPHDTIALQMAVRDIKEEFTFINLGYEVDLPDDSAQRMISVMKDVGAVALYSDFREDDGTPHRLIPYLDGSVRDDFDFGAIFAIRTFILQTMSQTLDEPYKYAAFYDLRLRLSRLGKIFHLPEILYTRKQTDFRKSGEKQFDYVDPRNREVQIEYEKVCTNHLSTCGAKLKETKEVPPAKEDPIVASVVIPVRNREKTIMEAVHSALSQTTNFAFNVIVVNNHSTDKTTELLRAETDKRLIHLQPERTDLNIGGCWMEAVRSEHCGTYVVQLDSDDLYADEHTLQKMIDMFRNEKCGIVIGSYKMVDFDLNPLPPGIIDHREWTANNGWNNAMRINGLGAPRAFIRNLLREHPMPNVSYGEDYAAALRICSEYKMGRIYEPIYLCRRWTGNSDHSLSQEQINANNYYKDTIRTIEIARRTQWT